MGLIGSENLILEVEQNLCVYNYEHKNLKIGNRREVHDNLEKRTWLDEDIQRDNIQKFVYIYRDGTM